MSYGQQGWQPQDAVPYGQWNQPQQYPPAPGPQPYYPPQQHVVVNVVQNAGPGTLLVRRPVNHKLHAWLTLLTGGAWLFVWIPLAIRGKKQLVRVYR